MRILTLVLVAVVLVVGAPGAATAAPATTPIDACLHPEVPAWFHRSLATAIRVSRDLRTSWANAPAIERIACWQGADYDVTFRAKSGPLHVWHGLFAMTVEEMQTMQGVWMTRTRDAYELNPVCFVRGWDGCPHTVATTRIVQQDIAALRWIWLLYGSPVAAWHHIVLTGRFDSYPRPRTVNAPTNDPFALCPVRPPVHYRDDFGERRTVGGYHPHWGNDIIAPSGRPIRAPFAGLAVAHSDDWFAGNYVTVVGPNGYVRNGHLSRFGHLGAVTAGEIIGYVGETGDARGPHDHFEWHPWAVGSPRHRAPSGFVRVMDAVDPYPFLNRVCGPAAAATGPTRSLEP